jgi:asparagine synthase (glutamine-hydrolysing)
MAASDDLAKAIYLETMSRLPSWVLWKTDRNGMANSVEVRVPYLDHRVVEHLNGLPNEMKSVPGETKVAIRLGFAHLLPARIAKRAKFAFNTPADWLLAADGRELGDILSPASLREVGLFEPVAVRALFDEVSAGAGARGRMMPTLACQVLTGVVTTQILHQLFVA